MSLPYITTPDDLHKFLVILVCGDWSCAISLLALRLSFRNNELIGCYTSSDRVTPLVVSVF